MKRLFYVVDDIETTQAISDVLHDEGIIDWNFHVLARDEAGLVNHRIHAANLYQQLDLLHTGSRFGVVGAAVGLLLGLLGYWLAQTGALGFSFDVAAVILITLVGGMFGSWQGGMVGMSRENYKVARFHDDIEAGRYLVMVDVHSKNKTQIREVMSLRFPEVEYGGSDSTLINPFASGKKVYPQTTH